jgi:hypothetical protein
MWHLPLAWRRLKLLSDDAAEDLQGTLAILVRQSHPQALQA